MVICVSMFLHCVHYRYSILQNSGKISLLLGYCAFCLLNVVFELFSWNIIIHMLNLIFDICLKKEYCCYSFQFFLSFASLGRLVTVLYNFKCKLAQVCAMCSKIENPSPTESLYLFFLLPTLEKQIATRLISFWRGF